MAQINLMPWRERQREAQRKRFLLGLCGVLLAAMGVIGLGECYIDGAIDRQMARNAYIDRQLRVLDERIQHIDELRLQRQQLVERMRTVHDLLDSQSTSGRVFDQLARALPDNLFLTSVRRQAQWLSISGIAGLPAQVSALMRNLDQAPGLDSPSLAHVKAGSGELAEQGSGFQLTVRQVPASAMEGTK